MKELRTKQMVLFELLEPQDINYSNFVDFFDNLPLFIDDANKRYWDYENVKPSVSTQFKFKYEGKEKVFLVTLRPARIIDLNGSEVLVYPSIQREQSVYDALRRLACSGSGGLYGDDQELGASFSLQTLIRELSKFKKTLSIPQIKESLNVLRSAEIRVQAIDGSFEWSPSYLSNMALINRKGFLNDEGDPKCLVLFDSLVSSSVKKLEFREYNYAIAQSTKNAIAKYLLKRMDRKFKQASTEKTYTIKMSTIFAAIYRKVDKKMSNNSRHMKSAFDEMKKKLRIIDVKSTPIKSEIDTRKTIDYSYTIYPHVELISDVKRYHAKRGLMMTKNAILSDDMFIQGNLDIK